MEPWAEPEFDSCPWAMGQNVRDAQKWLEIELERASRQYRFELSPAICARLAEPPMTVQNFGLQQQYSGGPTPLDSPWVEDAALALFCATSGLPDDTKWEALTKPQRRKAKALAASFLSTNRVLQKGASIDTGVPLLLYLIFTIEELIGKPFPMSRPAGAITGRLSNQTPPCGPAFMLLRAAYAHASVKLHVMPSKPETVYSVARVARSRAFRSQLEELRRAYVAPEMARSNSSFAEFVATHPSKCALLFAKAKAKQDE